MPLSYRDMNGTKKVLDWAIKWKADAIIGQFYASEDVAMFRRHGILAIAQDFKSRFDNIPNIIGDHYLAGRIGARHLISKGFRNFAFYGFDDRIWSQERCDGFKNELRAGGFAGNYFEYNNREIKEIWYYESEPLIKWLKALPAPIGIMACDDNQSHHLAEMCKINGLQVPQQIALLGVDNDETICTLTSPPLSSIDQAVEQAGYQTAEMIERFMADPDAVLSNVCVMPTYVVTRQSTDIYATDDRHIAVVLDYIHRNISDRLNVTDISKLVPMSKRLLETRFKQVTNDSIYNYIFNLRMQKFAQELIETDNTIIEIATALGLSDHKNIARQFKNIKGCTPSEYRLSHSLKK
jgi:LacI family transcriptional regulator